MFILYRRMRHGLLRIKPYKLTCMIVFFLLIILLLTERVFYSAQAASPTTTYHDSKLGFSIQVPTTWSAHPQPVASSTVTNTDVLFTTTNSAGTQIELNVIRSSTASSHFAQGFATFHIGSYLAFAADTPASQQYPVACLGRIMLAGNDYITAHWCAPDAYTHAQQFAQILATYLPSGGGIAAQARSFSTVNPVESCAQVKSGVSSVPNPAGSWGTQQGNPTDSQWTTHFSSGVAVCDDFVKSTDTTGWTGYNFQCVELANRFIHEEWGLPSFTVEAAQYYDYYMNGARQSGAIRTFPSGSYTLSADGSQIPHELPGAENFMPSPGDLLIYQDVNDRTSWTSGLVSGRSGHVVVITDVASDHVAVAQQNYTSSKYYTTLPMSDGPNGYQITPPDKSYDSYRIVRGWIHFTANPNNNATVATTTTVRDTVMPSTYIAKNSNGALITFAHGTDNNIWYNQQSGAGWGSWTPLQIGKTFNGDPAVGMNADGRLEVFARGSDNNIWHIWQTSPSGGWSSWSVLQTGYTFQGTPAVAANAQGQLEVFARSSDNRIWHMQQQPQWSNWSVLQSSGQFLGDPIVGKNAVDQLQVFALANDHNIWSIGEGASAGSWNSWGPLPTGQQFQGKPAVGTNADGSFEVFARGSDANLWYSVQRNGTWSAWSLLQSGTQFSGDPVVGVNANRSLEVFARSTRKNAIYYLQQMTPGGDWTPAWEPLQGVQQFQGTPAVGTNADGRLTVIALGGDENIWQTSQLTPGGLWVSWGSWTPLQTGNSFQQ